MSVDEGSQIRALTIYQASLGDEFDIDPRDDTSKKGLKPVEKLVKLKLKPKPGQCMRLSRDLISLEHMNADFLHMNAYLFAWQPSDMSGIHPSIIYHKLAICPQAKPMSHKKRKMGEEWRKVIKEEVDKLLNAKFIREVWYSTWLTNIVMVKKANDKW